MEKRALQSLTSSQISEIVRRSVKETRTALSQEFGVSVRTITRIKQTYKHVSNILPDDESFAPNTSNRVCLRKKQVNLDYKARKRIIKRLNTGETIEHLAKKYGVSYRTVQRLWRYQDDYLAKINVVKETCGNLGKKRLTEESPLDKAVIAWYKSELIQLGADQIPGNTIREKALTISKEIGGAPNFKASSGWLWSFKKRYGLLEPIEQDDPSESLRDATIESSKSATSNNLRRQDGEHFISIKQELLPENFVVVSEQAYVEETPEIINVEEAYRAATALVKFIESNMPRETEKLSVVRGLRDRIFNMI